MMSGKMTEKIHTNCTQHEILFTISYKKKSCTLT